MRKNTCEIIRRELDELTLDETCSTSAVKHLRDCSECREFHEKQTKLRQIVGSLGTVAAPADFDFRLRARLANESGSAASHFSFLSWPAMKRGLVAAALLLVFANVVFLIQTVVRHRMKSDEMAKQKAAAAQQNETPKPQETVTPNTSESPKQEDVAVNPSPLPKRNGTERTVQLAVRNKQPLATREISSTGAQVIRDVDPLASSDAFPIDASSVQTFKLSVDDGRGNAKTISVPTISFGSQRLMQNANPFAPKRVW